MTPAKMVMAALVLPALILVGLVAVVAALMGCAKRRARVRSTAGDASTTPAHGHRGLFALGPRVRGSCPCRRTIW
jgi:hypothetical protein